MAARFRLAGRSDPLSRTLPAACRLFMDLRLRPFMRRLEQNAIPPPCSNGARRRGRRELHVVDRVDLAGQRFR
jgi:hypothetical protein